MNGIFFFFLLSLSETHQKINDAILETLENTRQVQLRKCLENLIRKEFAADATLVFLVDNPEFDCFTADNPQISIKQPQIVKNADGYVILTKNVTVIQLFQKKFASIPNKYIFFLFEHFQPEDVFLNARNIHEIYLVEAASDFLNLHASFPLWYENECGRFNRPEYIGVCDDISVRNIDLNKCKATAALFSLHLPLPYMGDPFSDQPGVLVHPLKLFSQKYGINISYEAQPSEKEEDFVKRGMAALLDDLESGRFDVIVCEPYRFAFTYKTVATTDIVFFNPHVWILPKPNKKPNFEVIVSIFAQTTWLLIFAVLPVMITVWYVTARLDDQKQFQDFGRCVLEIYVLNFTIGLTHVPTSKKLRTLLILYILYSFHLSYFFQGKLSGVLTAPNYEKRVTNLQQLVDSQLTTIVFYNNIESIKEMNTTLARKFADKTKVIAEEGGGINRPQYVIEHGDVALTAFAADLNMTDAYRRQVDVIEDMFLFNLEATYQLRKGNPIRDVLNGIIRGVTESGLQHKWMSDMRKITFLPSDDDMIVLTFEHLEGPFILLFFGLVLAFCVFLLEILWNKCNSFFGN